MTDKTIKFSIKDENETEMRKNLLAVYEALNERGYNSISQIVGYILSEDPTYITTHNNARSLVRRLDRDTVFTIEPHLKVFDGYAQIDGEEMKHRFHFTNGGEAFDAAVAAIKKIIVENGYKETDGGFVKI